MQAQVNPATYRWICTGQEIFPAMLHEIGSARNEVCLETYMVSAGSLAQRFLEALTHAAERGVRVQVLIDGLGSYGLPAAFWDPLRHAGGNVRVFNPINLNRLGIRDHRKLLVCDESVAFVGGFNIAPEYEGDGVSCGWCDVGVRIEGPLVAKLGASFREMFDISEFKQKRFARIRKSLSNRSFETAHEQLLLSGPGRSGNPIKTALKRDLSRAESVHIMIAYFLPTWRLRRQLMRLARQGARVRLLLAGKSDVLLSKLAGQSLYRRFLRSGVEIYEYQPQILHAKLLVVNDAVYVGSANLDQRSLNINYELMVRLTGSEVKTRAMEIFENNLRHSSRITLPAWQQGRTTWRRIKQHLAYWVLARLDPYIAYRQWRALPD